MTHEEQSWSPSELIYLFVDGEADDVQKSTLFASLANDVDLQAEFADALQINAATESEIGSGGPPDEITAALFQQAGLWSGAVEQSGAVGGGPAVASVREESRARRALRRAVLPLTAAFAGTLAALLIAPNLLDLAHPSAAEATVAPPVGQTTTQPREEYTAGAGGLAGTNRVGGAAEAVSNRLPTPAAPPAGESVAADHAGSESSLPAPSATPNATLSRTVDSASAFERRRSALTNGRVRRQWNGIVLDDRQATSPDYARPAAFENAPEESAHAFGMLPLSIRVRGIIGLGTFPTRSLPETRSGPFDNIAIAGLYRLSPSVSVGLEVGRERHPLFVRGNNSTGGNDGDTIDFTGQDPFDPTITEEAVQLIPADGERPYSTANHVAWIGAAAEFRAAPVGGSGTLRPFAQTVLGASRTGPLGKATVGLAWRPDTRVSFGLGLEGTALLYRNRGSWYSSRKLGVSYSMHVDF